MSDNLHSTIELMPGVPPGPEGKLAAATPFERVYRGIIRALYEGRYAPGQRLAAPDLMREFDAGRGTIREVLQRLASTGVLRIEPQKGARVRRLTRREVEEVLELVEIMLGLAARNAALAVANDTARTALVERYETLMNCRFDEDFSAFAVARENYYRCLMQIAGNRELLRIFPSIQVHIMRTQLRTFNRAGDSVYPSDYEFLQEAVLAMDVDRAERAGRIHVQRTMGRIADLPDRAFEPEA